MTSSLAVQRKLPGVIFRFIHSGTPVSKIALCGSKMPDPSGQNADTVRYKIFTYTAKCISVYMGPCCDCFLHDYVDQMND